MTDWPEPKTLYKAALRFARAGQPVFPCYSELTEVNGKTKKPKSPMVKWQDAATTDPATIKRWWQRQPNASIAIPTGIKFDVLDVDTRNGDGRLHLVRLSNLGLLAGCKRVIKTPSGGFHLYFTPNPMLTNKARGASTGLDVRAKGGYVLVPPSYIVDDEKGYEGPYVDLGATTGSTDEVLQWDLIVNEITPMDIETKQPIDLPPREQQRSIAGLKHTVANAKEGERNNILFWAVNRCIENGFDPHELMEAASLCGIGEDEVLQTINSALKRAGVRVEELGSEMEVMVADMFPDEVDE